MKHRWLNAMLYGALSLASSLPIAADEKPDLSVATDSANVADPRAPSGLSKLAFLIGEWDMDTSFLIKGETTHSAAKLRARYAMGGFAIEVEEVHPALGSPEVPIFVSTELWVIRPGSLATVGVAHNTLGNRKFLEASIEDGKLLVVAHGEMFKGAKIINRTIYSNIGADRFELANEVSGDGGRTWKDGGYSAVATRTTR